MSSSSYTQANTPQRGEIWYASLDPIIGREQSGRRPVLVVSDDRFNAGPSELVIVLPITSKLRGIPSHIEIKAGEGGLAHPSAIMCEAVRSVSRKRLRNSLGVVTPSTLAAVERAMVILLGL